jgi:hypothetical protein
MSRTWLVRGGAIAAFVVIVGAWASSFAGFGDTPSPVPVVTPDSGERAPDYRIVGSTVVEKAKDRRTPGADVSQTTDATVDTGDDAVSTPTDPTTVPSTPGTTPSSPSPDPTDPDSPTPTPNDPDDECTDLGGILDCALNPATSRP